MATLEKERERETDKQTDTNDIAVLQKANAGCNSSSSGGGVSETGVRARGQPVSSVRPRKGARARFVSARLLRRRPRRKKAT